MRLSDDFISELKYRSDISEIASSYMQLKRRGRNLVGLCPFHGEKTPSFNIYTENGSFYCFGCGVGGDVITFIMKIENLDYIEAVKFLAQRAGMTVPEDDFDDSMSKLRSRIFEANREAARFYYSKLYSEEGKRALEYLHSRGLSDNIIRRFGLGYSPASRFALCDHLKKMGFSESDLTTADLAKKARNGNGVFDSFFDRVMFPIIDLRGNVIAFGGRVMSDKKPKYLNTSDTPVFSKSKNLFSLNNAKNSKSDSLILCEGYMDVIALNRVGFSQAVATLGTALTLDQAMLMKRYCKSVTICYDADEAGQKATSRAIDILRRASLPVNVLTVPDGKDPDEFIRNNGENGAAAFKNILDNSGNDVDYRLFKISQAYDLTTVQGRIAYLNEAVKLLSTLDNPLERDIYASKISDVASVSKQSIDEQLKKELSQRRKTSRKNEFSDLRRQLSARNDRINPEHADNLRAVSAEESLIAYLVNNPDRCDRIERDISSDDFVTSFNRKLYIYFLDRIKTGVEPMTSLSADFTGDEISRIVKIVNSYNSIAATDRALSEYISTIKSESSKPTKEDIANASDDDLKKMIQSVKKRKI